MPSSTDAPEGAFGGARPFASAEDAWRWTMAALVARRDGAGPVLNVGAVARPCEPDDVVRILDRLYRTRRITLEHARVLGCYGERVSGPDPQRQSRDFRIWSEAIERLGGMMRKAGIVAGPRRARAAGDGVPCWLTTEARALAGLQALSAA